MYHANAMCMYHANGIVHFSFFLGWPFDIFKCLIYILQAMGQSTL
jgi:hypothetical protein